MGKDLIVNADDFNLTAGVTRGILDAHRRGIVTSATVMVNLPGLAQSRDLARDATGLGLGLHINLTLGRPVLPAHRLPSLVDARGEFVRDRDRLGETGDPQEIRDEALAQLRRFLDAFGIPPTHLDTHYHMHRLPRVLGPILEIAGARRVPVRALTAEMAASIRALGLPAVDRAAGDVGREPFWTVEALMAFIASIGPGVTELMCHPGYADASLSTSGYTIQREGELRALCDPRVRRALSEAGVRLIDYRELSGPAGGLP